MSWASENGPASRDMCVHLKTVCIGLTTIELVHQFDSPIRDGDYLEPLWFVIHRTSGGAHLTARYYNEVEARQKFDEAVSFEAYRSLVGGE